MCTTSLRAGAVITEWLRSSLAAGGRGGAGWVSRTLQWAAWAVLRGHGHMGTFNQTQIHHQTSWIGVTCTVQGHVCLLLILPLDPCFGIDVLNICKMTGQQMKDMKHFWHTLLILHIIRPFPSVNHTRSGRLVKVRGEMGTWGHLNGCWAGERDQGQTRRCNISYFAPIVFMTFNTTAHVTMEIINHAFCKTVTENISQCWHQSKYFGNKLSVFMQSTYFRKILRTLAKFCVRIMGSVHSCALGCGGM